MALVSRGERIRTDGQRRRVTCLAARHPGADVCLARSDQKGVEAIIKRIADITEVTAQGVSVKLEKQTTN